MQKIYSFFAFLIVIFLNCAYCFPEELPAPLDFDTFTFDKIKFGQTNVGEFSYLAPSYKSPSVEGIYTIFSESNLDKNYKLARIGFKDNFLDWIELEFTVPQSMSKYKQIYGSPKSVNTAYSNKFNYQDYGFFNFVTDKNNGVIFAVTLYGESDFNPAIKNLVSVIPDYKNLNSLKNVIPGTMMENDFTALYTNFQPSKVSQDNIEKTFSVPSKYLRHSNYYSAIDIFFSNGILSFINVKPKNLSITDIKNIYGNGENTLSSNKDVEFKEYKNFVVTYNKATNRVLSIGIIGAD